MQPSYVPYINLNDYLVQIRSGQLNNQILDYVEEGGDIERQNAEAFALDEIRSILGSYFYLDFEFRQLLPFNYNKKYFAGDRCIMDFPSWIKGSGVVGESFTGDVISYSVGDCRLYNGGVGYSTGSWDGTKGGTWIAYCCKNDNSDTTFKLDNWIAIGNQFDIYYVNFPYPIFQLEPTVQIGIDTPGIYTANESNVCWVNNIYSCIKSSDFLNHQAQEQYYQINSIPTPNIFPNQKGINQQWLNRGEFSFKEILPFYPNLYQNLNEGVDAWTEQYRKNWTLGDNRSATMVQIVVAISVYQLLGRNSFMLKERAIRRDWAYRKLTAIKNGERTTLIPIIQPEQAGGGFQWGGSPKIINTF